MYLYIPLQPNSLHIIFHMTCPYIEHNVVIYFVLDFSVYFFLDAGEASTMYYNHTTGLFLGGK